MYCHVVHEAHGDKKFGVNCFPLTTLLKFFMINDLENTFFFFGGSSLFCNLNLEMNNNNQLLKVISVFLTAFGIINRKNLFRFVL